MPDAQMKARCYIVSAEDRCIKRGVKESITVRLQQPSLSRPGALWLLHLFFSQQFMLAHNSSNTYTWVVTVTEV